MIKRTLLLLLSKCKAIVKRNIAFSSRVEYSNISSKAKVWGHCKLFYAIVGDYSYIGPNTRLIHTQVGKFCSIARDCAIGMGNHSLDYLSTSSIFTAKKNGVGISWTDHNSCDEFKELYIGNDVWIGQRAMVMGGVRIGNGAVVGAGAVVTKDVPPYAIVGGVPAKILRYRFTDEVIEKLEASQWWMLDDDVLKGIIPLFQKPAEEFNVEKLISLYHK